MTKKLIPTLLFSCFLILQLNGQILDSAYFETLKKGRVSSSDNIEWEQVGPGNSGYCDVYFIHPTDNKTMFMSPDLDNSYVTIDDGETWNTLKDDDGDGDYMREFTGIDFSRQNANFGFAVDVRGRLLKTESKGTSWTRVNSFPATKRQSALAVDPQNDNIWYVGGGDFFNVKANHRNLAMLNNRNLSYRYDFSEYGNIYKTTNKGASWTKISGAASGLPNLVDIGKIIIKPDNSNTIIIATSHGMYRSTNGGTNWQTARNGLPNNMPRDLTSRIENGVFTLYCIDQTKYVSVGTGSNRSINSIGGIYKSTNNGGNWTNVTGDLGINLTKVSSNNTRNKYYKAVAYWLGISQNEARNTYPKLPENILPVFNRIVVDPRNSTRIYVAHNTKHDFSFGPGDIWSTNNSGEKWAPVMRTGSYWNNNTNNNYWSTKGATNANAGFSHIRPEIDRAEEIHGNRFLAIDSRGYVYGSVDQQTHRSTDNGVSWVQRDDIKNGANGWQGRGNSNLPGRSIIMETGVTEKYLFLSGEHGLWQSVSPNSPKTLKQIEGQINRGGSTSIASAAVHPTNPDIIYTMQFRQKHRGELRKTTNGGDTWTTVSEPLPPSGNTSQSSQILNHSLTIDYQNPSILYFNTIGTPINEVFGINAPFSQHGVYKSSNDGINWSRVNGTGSNVLPVNGKTVNRIKMDPDSPNILYAACVLSANNNKGGLYKTTDRGNNWIKMNIPSQIKSVNNVFIEKKSGNNNIYISCGSFNGAPNEGGVWKSSNNGNTWLKVFDMPYVWYTEVSKVNPDIITVVVGGQNVKNNNIKVFNPGAYISFDGGNTWLKANKNLGQPHKVLEVRPDFSDQNVFWSSLQGSGWTRAVYNGTLGVDDVDDKGEKPSQSIKLYPNPASNSFTLQLHVNSSTKDVKINIFSIEGKHLLKTTKEVSSNAINKIELSTDGLSVGTYLIKIETNDNEYFKRFIKE